MRGQEMNAIVDVNFLLRTPPPDLGGRLREATLPAQSRSRILRFPMIFDNRSTSKRATRSGSAAQMLAAFRMARIARLVATGFFRTNSLLPEIMQQKY